MNTKRALQAVLALGIILGATNLWTCRYPEGAPYGNVPPNTRIADVPANDTIARYIDRNTLPEITLNWVGDDPDGYVIGYQYRWVDSRPGETFPPPDSFSTVLNIVKPGWANMILVTSHTSSISHLFDSLAAMSQEKSPTMFDSVGRMLNSGRTFAVPYSSGIVPGDSVAGAPQLLLQSPQIGTFIFASPIDSNVHRFEVRSIDNKNEVDPTSAFLTFWTIQSPGCVAAIDSTPDTSSYVIRYATTRWAGLRFKYRSLDKNNQLGLTFSYAVDDTNQWSDWSDASVANIPGSELKPLQSGWHHFYVRARNRWGVISDRKDTTFKVIVPAMDTVGYHPRVLIIDDNPSVLGQPLPARVDSFYRAIMDDSLGRAGQYDIYTRSSFPTQYPLPSKEVLGNYSAIVFLCDRFIPPLPTTARTQSALTTAQILSLKDYLFVGGKLIWSGTPSIKIIIPGYDSQTLGSAQEWTNSIFHIIPLTPQLLTQLTNSNRDCIGARAVSGSGYPDMRFDPAKLPPDSLGAIRHISLNPATNFATNFSTFDSQSNNPFFENQGLGVRYLSLPPIPPRHQTFCVVHFGLPLYFVETPAVVAALRQAFIDVDAFRETYP